VNLSRHDHGRGRTLDELAAWLRVALDDRFAGIWVLAASTGMRRSELAGVERDTLDLNQGTVAIENTRIVVKATQRGPMGRTDAPAGHKVGHTGN
jgi:integrase